MAVSSEEDEMVNSLRDTQSHAEDQNFCKKKMQGFERASDTYWHHQQFLHQSLGHIVILNNLRQHTG